MKTLTTLIALLLTIETAAACSYFDRVYKDFNSSSTMTQAVYRCGGTTEVRREWICRTNPEEQGVDSYTVDHPRCAGQESEYDELKRKASEVQK